MYRGEQNELTLSFCYRIYLMFLLQNLPYVSVCLLEQICQGIIMYFRQAQNHLHNSNLTKCTKLKPNFPLSMSMIMFSSWETGTQAKCRGMQQYANTGRSADERQVCLRGIYRRWNTANYSQHNSRYEIQALPQKQQLTPRNISGRGTHPQPSDQGKR